MSLPPHREKDAKAEGRGPPETAKETMAPFRSLVERLLKVPMNEVKEQQRLYEETRSDKPETRPLPKMKKKPVIVSRVSGNRTLPLRDK